MSSLESESGLTNWQPLTGSTTPQPSDGHAQRLGLLGGSFNPIHNGHVTIACQVLDMLGLDRIVFIPTGDPPHKQESLLAAATDRLEMVRLAIAGTPFFEVSDVEVQREGKSYSIDTVRELQRQNGPSSELFFIIGLDAFLDFSSWREPQALLNACRFVVVPRPGHSFRSLTRLSILPTTLDSTALARLDSGQLARMDIPISTGSNVICLSLPLCSISSSDIRLRIRSGATLANLLPPPVESYILHHSLYQEDRYRTRI